MLIAIDSILLVIVVTKAVESKGHGSYSAPPLLPEATWPSDTRSPEASRGAGNPDFHVKLKHCSFQTLREETILILHHVFQKIP